MVTSTHIAWHFLVLTKYSLMHAVICTFRSGLSTYHAYTH